MMNPFYDQFKHMATVGSGMGDDDDNIGHVYKSVLYQRGFGIGHEFDFGRVHGLGFADGLMSMIRMAMPVIKKGVQFLGNHAVSTVANIAQDAIAGENVKDSARKRVSEAAEDIFARVPQALAANVLKTQGRKRLADSRSGKLVASGRWRAKRSRFARENFEDYPGLEKLN